MSASKKRGKRYQPGRVVANPIRLAISGACTLPPVDRQRLVDIGRHAVEALQAGIGDPVEHWAQIVDLVNISEALATAGICSDQDSRYRIHDGMQTLSDLMQQQIAGGSMAPTPAQRNALDEALWLHGVQLEHCSALEFERAYRRVVARTKGALAGNVPPGVKVIAAQEKTA